MEPRRFLWVPLVTLASILLSATQLGVSFLTPRVNCTEAQLSELSRFDVYVGFEDLPLAGSSVLILHAFRAGVSMSTEKMQVRATACCSPAP